MSRSLALFKQAREIKKGRTTVDGFTGLLRVPADFLINASHSEKVAYAALHRPDAAVKGVALIPEPISREEWTERTPKELAALMERVRIELDDKSPDYAPRKYEKLDTANDNFPGFNRYALPVSQVRFLQCPIYEALFHGSRGTGKTDTLIIDFFQDVGQGWGEHLKGLILRRTFKALEDAIAKSKKIFRKLCPKAKYNGSDYKWVFPTGEELRFGYLDAPKDYENYHGHEYTFLGFEELSLWSTLDQYKELKTCVRSPIDGIPLKVRSTSNPSGPGHNAVKKYFIDVCAPGEVYTDPETGIERTRICSSILENVLILHSYLPTLLGIDEPHKRRAWLLDDWNVRSGGAIDDLWDVNIHRLQPFKVPRAWYVDRSYDHGESSPGSVLWWAESNGEEVTLADGTKRAFAKGTLFLIQEWYIAKKGTHEGLGLSADQIAREIKDCESKGMLATLNVRPGPADNAINTPGSGRTPSIHDEMRKCGVSWTDSDKSPGSRVNGLSLFRQRLRASLTGATDKPGFYVFSTCQRWIENVPVLARDPKNPDDVESKQPDHDYDSTRYRVLAVKRESGMGKVGGL